MANYYLGDNGELVNSKKKKNKKGKNYTLQANGTLNENKTDDIAPVKQTTKADTGKNTVSSTVSSLEEKLNKATELYDRYNQKKEQIQLSKKYSGRNGWQYNTEKEDRERLTVAEAEYNNYLKKIGYKSLDELKTAYNQTKTTTDKRTWFQKGALEDGVTVGNVAKGVSATRKDVGTNLWSGILGIGEKLVDAAATLGTAMASADIERTKQQAIMTESMLGRDTSNISKQFDPFANKLKKDTAEFVAKDLYDEEAIAKKIISDPYEKLTGINVEENSFLGEKSDALVQSGGQLLAQVGADALLPGSGMVLMGATTFGSEAENAFNNDASFDEAFLSATISAGAEMLTEKIGGVKFGGKTLTDAGFQWLSKKLTGKLAKGLLTAGKITVDALAEGGEEVLSGYLSAAGQQMTYMEDKEIEELFSDEDRLESFIGGIVLGGASGSAQAVVQGKGYVTGLTKNEQAVVDKLYDDAIAEKEKDGKKLTSKEKAEIYDDIIDNMEKGGIKIDTIEEVLGGEDYAEYKKYAEFSEGLTNEINELGSKTTPTLADQYKYPTLQKRLEETNAKKDSARAKLDEKMLSVLGNDRLVESYNEVAKRKEAFKADLTQYDEKQRKAVERAIKSGVLNDTRMSHMLVNTLSRIEADKGIVFDYTNNENLKKSGFAINGKTINGFVKDGNVTLNVQSSKSWQSVVGHEITHVLEGTEAYSELQNVLFEVAKSKGELDSRRAELTELYKKMDADIDAELTADLIGDYLFSNKDFINKLAGNKKTFRAVYNEIKYLCKVATGRELTEIEKVRQEFDKAWKELSDKGIDTVVENAKGKTQLSVSEIVDENKKSYGVGVHLDSTLLDNLSSNERVEMVKEYIKELGGEVFTAYDGNGNATDITIAESEQRFKNQKGKKIPVNKDLTKKYIKNETKQEAISLIDELIVTARYDDSKPAAYPHGWLDDNGKNDWEYWTTYIQDKNNTIWEATLNVANAADGRKILYDITPIKKVGQSIKLDTIPTDDIIPQNSEKSIGTVKYSVSTDSQGNELSLAVQKRFANSKAVDENGNLKVLYHGTASGEFFTFDKAKGSVEGDFGSGFYFTDNEYDVERNYEGGGADFENKVARRAEQIEAEEGIDYSEAEKRAREELYKGSNKFEVYLNIENPAIVGETTLFDYESYAEEYDREDYDSDEDYEGDVEQLIADDIDQIIWDIDRNVDIYSTDGIAEVLWNAVNEGGIDIEQLKANINNLYLEDSNGNLVGNEVTRQIIESLGYDGIIDNTVSTKFNMELEEGTTHYIVFKPNQIKSIDNQNPTDNPDIRYSLSENAVDNVNDLVYNGRRGEGYVTTDEFRNLQAESQRMSNEDIQSYWSGNKQIDDELRRRFSGSVKQIFLESRNNGKGNDSRLLEFAAKGNQYNIYENVDSALFHDVFEIARKHLQFGELVDLHEIETTEEHGIGYKYCNNYLSEDGLSGFSITPDGDLISVFNASGKRGFLRAIAPFVKKNAKTLDCYASPEQNLQGMYESIFGLKTASLMDYNMKFDHDNIAKNHNMPKVAFMVNTDADAAIKEFTKDQYDEAVAYRNGFVMSENIAPVKNSLSNVGEKSSSFGTPLKDLALEQDIAPVANSPERVTIPESAKIANGMRSDELLYESLDNYPMQTVEQKVAEKIRAVEAELADNRALRAEAETNYNKQIAKLQEQYNSKKKKDTKTAYQILQSISRLERLKASNEANFAKRISDLEARAEKMKSPKYTRAMQKQAKMQEHADFAANLLGDTSTWVDKKLGLQYATNTERRNLRDIVRDEAGNVDIARADAIDEALNGKYNQEEAAKKRELAKARGKYAELKITKAEDGYIQMLGELRHNPETSLTEKDVKEYYEKHKSKIDTAKVDKVIEMARQDYDQWIQRVNAELKEQGMREIPYRQGYFPHFTEPKQNFIQKLLNWKTQDDEIPTSIAGLTETFKPVKSWQSFDKQRHGDTTDYSFLKGFDTYSEGVLDWIYHLDTLQKRRAVENHIRYTHSDEGIRARIKEVYANEEIDANEAQAQIEQILAEAKNPLNNFVQDFTTHTNILAGKKNSLDRTVEQATNRHIYSVMTNVQNRLSANMVLANVRSALTNFIPITQSWAQVSPLRSLQATKDTIANAIKDDGLIDKSTFLTNRLREVDKLYQTNWDKVLDKAGIMFEIVDNFSSQVIWRSKYNQNLANGMTESQAIKNADQFSENVMAGRSKGNEPTLFNAKNPLVKAFTMFQLEVNNQYGYLFKDVPNDLKAETNHWKLNLAKGYTTAFIGAYVYNALFSKLTGSDAALDPIGIIEDLLRDLGLFDDDEEKEPDEVVTNLVDNVVEELPFVGGLFGGGRIPISSALPYSDDGLSGAIEDISEGNWKNIGKEMMNPILNVGLPVGGGQLKKTYQGLSMFSDEHPVTGSYTDSGNLRFPVEDTLGNRIQAGLFGQYASENAREYFDNDYAPLKEKQIQEYIDVEMPIKDYWEYREGLAKQEKLEDKLDYISGLDLPVSKKNILANNVTDRKEPLDLTNYDDFSSLEEFDYATKNPDKYAVAKSVGGYDAYKQYSGDLYDIKADKDANGKSISGSRKAKVVEYINNLDADYYTKLILFKSEYPSDDTYNAEIINYINERNDLTYEERVAIYTELGFRVSNGYVYPN